jgi:hypothetical protein
MRVSSLHVGVGSVCAGFAAHVPAFEGAGGTSITLPLVPEVGFTQLEDEPAQISDPKAGCWVQESTVSLTSYTFAVPVQLMPAAGSHEHLQLAAPGTRPALPLVTLVA